MNNRKLSIVCGIVLSIFLLIPDETNAQEQRIVFPDRTMVVEEAFKEIERQTEILISINRSNFNFSRKVKFSHNNLPLNKALDQLLAKTGRTYVIKGNHLLIVPSKNPTEPVETQFFSEESKEKAEKQEAEVNETPVERVPIKFRELDLSKPPVDLDSLETALQSRKIDQPLRMPAEPSLNQTMYYTKRDQEGFTSGWPSYSENLPKYALRTNLLYAFGTFTPNVGGEFGINKSTTLLATFSYNGWNQNGTDTDNSKLCHWLAQVEYRHWLCESFNGHFVGAHGFYGYYNIAGKKIPMVLESNSDLYRYKGNVMGVGVSYGYQLMLAPRWNLEFNIGFGVGRMKYDKWDCERCGEEVEKDVSRIFFAPTKLGVSLVFIIN